jgi:hypothetical protein
MAVAPGRWAFFLVIFLLSAANAHVPVESALKRLGNESPSKRIRTCLSEFSPVSLSLRQVDQRGGFPNEGTSKPPDAMGPSLTAVSPSVEFRLAEAYRSPDYLHLFASPSSHSHLHPPGSQPGATI